MILFLLSTIFGDRILENINHAISTIDQLKKLTPYTSLNELFDVTEGASNKSIDSKRRKIFKTNQLFDGTPLNNELKMLVNSAYQVLTRYRDGYDLVLHHPTLFTRLTNDKWMPLLVFILVVFVFLLIDFSYAAHKVIFYKKNKKNKKKLPPKMWDMKLFSIFRRRIRKNK